jgi:hypothetical protein
METMRRLLRSPLSMSVLAGAVLVLPAIASPLHSLARLSSQEGGATDIGQPVVVGWSSVYPGGYVIVSGGAGIGGAADQFHFVYQPLTGDGAVTARVASLQPTLGSGLAGVMMRESLTAESRHASMVIGTKSGYTFLRRPETAGASLQTAGSAGNPPGWVRVVRSGDLFEAYQSLDGAKWVKVGSDTVPMGATLYVGLAATSRNQTAATTVVIDGFSVVAKEPATNEPPAVSITRPTAQALYTVPVTIPVEAIATDPEGRLSSVDFYADSTLVDRDVSVPYAISWSPSTPGSYSLTAVARDADGGMTTSGAVPVTIAAPNQPPVVWLTSPANGASLNAPATINLTATASDAEGQLARVDFFHGTTLLFTDVTAPYAFSWANVAAGTHTFTAAAYDSFGNKATSAAVSVTVTNGNSPPTVALSSPTTGAIFTEPATIPVASNAADAEGPVARVEFFGGGTGLATNRLATDMTAPYAFSWTGVPAGTYWILAVAYDSAGAPTSSAVVTVAVTGSKAAPTVSTAPSQVAFTVPMDHETNVTSYKFEIFATGADPNAARALASADLGKPAPDVNYEIRSNQAALFNNLAVGNYIATVTAIGPGGSTRSAAVAFTK